MVKKIDELKDKALSLNIELSGEETQAEIEAKIAEIEGPKEPTPTPKTSKTESTERMIPISDVKKLIAEALAAQKEENQPVKLKKSTEHLAHVWRLNGKWVVDFADRNFDYEKGQPIDPYIKTKIHAYNIYNQNKREFESWITLIYNDGSKEDIALNKYIESRTLVYCRILNRERVDASYTIGEVEKKKEGTDGIMVGTGMMIDQDVTKYTEIITVETPDHEKLTLPDYVIC